MADIAARREVRRRKILENSQSRLLRISGQVSEDNNTDNNDTKNYQTNSSSSSSSPSLLLNKNTNGVSPNEWLPSLVNSSWDDPMEIENEIIEADYQSNIRANTNKNHFINENIFNDNNSIVHNQNEMKYNNEDIHSNILQYSGQNVVSENIIDDKNETSSLPIIFINRSIYILLAAIMNLMLILKMENLFGKSIVVPFLLISLSRLWIIGQLNNNRRNNTTNSMIIAALILCNIRPKIIHTLKKFMSIINEFVNDIAIFIFSFVTIYYIITRYWIDFDSLLANKVEIIVDSHATTTT